MSGGGKGKKRKIPKGKLKKQTASWISLSLVYSSFGASVMNYPGPCLDTVFNNGNGILCEERTDFSFPCVSISVSAPIVQIESQPIITQIF
jgi:hypothetical protein